MLDHRVDQPSLLLAGLPPDDRVRAADALAGARTIELEADRDQAVELVLTAISKNEKPRGRESTGGSHHASSSHATPAAPPAPKAAEAVAPPRPPQGGNGKKKTNYDEM